MIWTLATHPNNWGEKFMMIWEFFFKAKFINIRGRRREYFILQNSKTENTYRWRGKKNCFVLDNFLGYSNIMKTGCEFVGNSHKVK